MIAIKQHSIQTKLVIFFFILTIALFLSVGFLFFGNTQTTMIKAKEKELMTLSEETSNKIERFLFERHGDIEVMSQSPVLKDKEYDSKLKFDYLESVRTAYKTYDRIFVIDTAGSTIVSSGIAAGDRENPDILGTINQSTLSEADFALIQDGKNKGIYFAELIKGGQW